MKQKGFQYIGFSIIVIFLYTIITNFGAFSGSLNSVFQIVKPVVYGIVIAYFLYPLVILIHDNFLVDVKTQRHPRLGFALSVGLVYLLVLFLFYLLYLLVAPGLMEAIFSLANIDYQVVGNNLISWWNDLAQNLPFDGGIDGEEVISQALDWLANFLSIENLTRYINNIANLTTSAFAIFMGIIVSIYMILAKDELFSASDKFFQLIFTEKRFKLAKKYFLHFEKTFKKFVVGSLLDALIIGILAFIGLLILRAPMFALLAIIIMVTNVIPYFGPFIGGIPAVLITIFITGSPLHGLWVGLYILAIQQFDGIYLKPRIFSDAVGVSSVWVLIAIIVGGAAFGIVGLLLCVPVAATIKDIFNEVYDYTMEKREKEKVKSANVKL